MKKILLALLIGTATLAATSSCTKEYYDVVPSITAVYSRTASQWGTQITETKTGKYITRYVDLTVPELSDYYVDQGIVALAISFDGEKTYNGLPATINGISYTYDYTTKSVRIYAQDPILADVPVNVPDKVFVKVSLTKADFVQ